MTSTTPSSPRRVFFFSSQFLANMTRGTPALNRALSTSIMTTRSFFHTKSNLKAVLSWFCPFVFSCPCISRSGINLRNEVSNKFPKNTLVIILVPPFRNQFAGGQKVSTKVITKISSCILVCHRLVFHVECSFRIHCL